MVIEEVLYRVYYVILVNIELKWRCRQKCPLEVGLGIVAQAMGAVAVVVPLCLVAAWPLSAVQSQQPIPHFDWHASSAAWPLSVLQSQQPVYHFDWRSSSAAWPLSVLQFSQLGIKTDECRCKVVEQDQEQWGDFFGEACWL